MSKEAAAKKWNECLVLIRKDLNNDAAFSMWFESVSATSLQGNRITLKLPSPFCRELYEGEYSSIVKGALQKVIGPKFDVDYLVPVVANKKGGSIKVAGSSDTSKKENTTKKPAEQEDSPDYIPRLNEDLSFENYCVTSCNKLPWTIAESIARNPVNSNFNPFFLYGEVGVGKTHLMQAIGLQVKKLFPDKRVVFLPMKEFQRLYQNAFLRKEIPAFLQWFMRCDVLLFDDLQEIVKSESTLNNALFPIFNHLHQHGKQLVFTCDRPPQDLKDLEDRLIDRFKWGIIEKLEKPDSSLRKKILTFKARKNGLNLPSDVVDYLTSLPLKSVREIEGIVLGMMLRSIKLGLEIDLKLAREVVARSVKPSARKAVNFDMIVEEVAERFNLNPDVLFSKSRVKDVAEARMTIMYVANHLLGLSYGSIGRKLGRKHSTVMHGIKVVAEKIENDSDYSDLVAEIESSL